MIIVLLSTYNGRRYICEQIDSLLKQKEVDIQIIVRDDGSTDGTHEILDEYQKCGILTWYAGANLRPAKSFMNLLKNAPISEYYAFCDQDDIWMPEKLNVAIEKIKNTQGPAMYCSDTLMVDSSLKIIRQAGIHADGTLVESLITNPVTGCTMVFNKALRDIVIQYIPETIDMHDWWIYRICMAIGGFFYFDPTPHIKYRQHENNVIGGQGSQWHKIKRHLNLLFNPADGIRYTMVKELRKGFYQNMSRDNKEILEMFVSYKESFLKTLKLVNSPQIDINNKNTIDTFKKAVLLRKY